MCALWNLGAASPVPAVWFDFPEFDIEILISGGDPAVADARGSD